MQPWHRQPDEPEDAYGAFCAYRDQTPPRRGLLVTLDGIPIPPCDIAAWHAKHAWKARLLAFDSHLESLRDAEREALLTQSVREVDAEHMAVLAVGRDLALREMTKTLLTSKAKGTETLKFRDLVALVDSVVKLDRLVRGKTTDNVGQGTDLSALTEEQLAQMEEIMLRGAKTP